MILMEYQIRDRIGIKRFLIGIIIGKGLEVYQEYETRIRIHSYEMAI